MSLLRRLASGPEWPVPRFLVRRGKALRAEVEDLRSACEASKRAEARLLRRIEFLENGHRTASRLIGELRGDHDRTCMLLVEAEARLALAVGDRLLATRLNDELVRQVQRLAGAGLGDAQATIRLVALSSSAGPDRRVTATPATVPCVSDPDRPENATRAPPPTDRQAGAQRR